MVDINMSLEVTNEIQMRGTVSFGHWLLFLGEQGKLDARLADAPLVLALSAFVAGYGAGLIANDEANEGGPRW